MGRTGPLTKDTSTIALGLAQIRVGPSAANVATATAALAAANSIGALANTKFTSNVDFWKLESGFPALEDLSLPVRESAMLECAFKEITPYNIALARGIDPSGAVSAEVTGGSSNTAAGATSGSITVDDNGGVITENWTVVFTAAGATGTYSVYGDATGLVGTADQDKTAQFAPDNGGNPYFTIPADFFDDNWAVDETYVFTTKAYSADAGYGQAHSGSIDLGGLKAPDYVRMEAVYTFPNGTNTMTIIFPRANVTSSMELDMQSEDSANVPISFEAKRADSEVTGGNAAWDSAPLGKIIFA